MTNIEVQELVKNKTLKEARETILSMKEFDLQMLYYWGFRLHKFIFSSFASQLLHERFGRTPIRDGVTIRTSEFT